MYLAPLVEELQQLWNGVLAYDVLKEIRFHTFRLRTILLWTIHNFLGYGTITGVAHQGYVACPMCGLGFRSEHSTELGKLTYMDTRRWLPHDDEEYGDAEEVLEAGTTFIMTQALRDLAHQYVLTNISFLDPWHRWICSIAVIVQ